MKVLKQMEISDACLAILAIMFSYMLLSSCSQKSNCPTVTKNYFMKGVPKPKPLYSGKYNKAYIVPKKYRKGIIGYGDPLKTKK
jgi:hypothetical protein